MPMKLNSPCRHNLNTFHAPNWNFACTHSLLQTQRIPFNASKVDQLSETPMGEWAIVNVLSFYRRWRNLWNTHGMHGDLSAQESTAASFCHLRLSSNSMINTRDPKSNKCFFCIPATVRKEATAKLLPTTQIWDVCCRCNDHQHSLIGTFAIWPGSHDIAQRSQQSFIQSWSFPSQ